MALCRVELRRRLRNVPKKGGEIVGRSEGRTKELYPKNKLKAARVAMGLKQTELAEMVGLSYQTYCLKERGELDLGSVK